jgi:hypothetical protein
VSRHGVIAVREWNEIMKVEDKTEGKKDIQV